jgi:hypothetical protein
MAKEKHIGKPMAALVTLLGLLVAGSAYYMSDIKNVEIALGIVTVLAGIVLWMHHARK